MSTKDTIAVVGASGFIGNRLVEVLHLSGTHAVRPVTRTAAGLAMSRRFPLEGAVADALDVEACAQAFEGCDVVVHALAGDMRTIRRSVAPVYRAAEQAGCRRLVYLSSAMVHGQSPPAGADERTPLPRGQRLPYNLAKRDAEATLFGLAKTGSVEAVVLRPGIVYGPRSQWIGGLADALLAGHAALVDGGHGLCNGIYVDNLVQAICLAATAEGVAGESFLLGEHALPTWRDVTERVATAMGLTLAAAPDVGFAQQPWSVREQIDAWRLSRPVRAGLAALPRPLREGLAAAWGASGVMPDEPASGPQVDLEMALLHRAQTAPSWRKAQERLGYSPVVDPTEAWRRTIAWLAFAGYPVALQ